MRGYHLKILFVLNIGFDRPGPSVHLLQFIMMNCVERNIRVYALLKDSTGQAQTIPEKLASSDLFSYETIKHSSEKKEGFFSRYIDDIRFARKCSKKYKNYKDVDVTFVQSNRVACFYHDAIRKIIGCPIVFNVQDVFPRNLAETGKIKRGGLIYRILAAVQKKGYNRAKFIITISDDMKQTLREEGVDEEKISVVYNWSYGDTPIEIPASENAFVHKFALDCGKFNAVYAGNIGRVQNVDNIIAAAEVLREQTNIHFYIVGDGVYKDRLMQKTTLLKNISFLPMQPSELAESIYSFADVNLIPLAKGIIKTALPSKTATCLRVRRPIIFCIDRDSAFAKLVEGNEMISVTDPDSGVALAEIISTYAAQKDRRYASEPFDIFEKHFKTINAEKYIALLEKGAGYRTSTTKGKRQ